MEARGVAENWGNLKFIEAASLKPKDIIEHPALAIQKGGGQRILGRNLCLLYVTSIVSQIGK